MKYPQILRNTGSLMQFSSGMFLLLILSACAGNPAVQRQQYDFGPTPTPVTSAPSAQAKTGFQIGLAEVTVPAALDSSAMLYRLQYDNVQQLKAYTLHRWSMTPADLLSQRLKARLMANGNEVLANTAGAVNLPVLRIDLDEFSQIFSSASQSQAQINLRASVIKAGKLIAQKSFQQQVAATSADAPGGARAMQEATDASINELQLWLAGLPLK
ncbi:ABC-type transport auxiliary lipoprotein family protein [Undibacterium sp. TJN19]|uniref:ABC-type transport auxiliary lipoprotein family protein n=1 Tax=Undibacterium sp. TJN19 TaxID=3413055 RepID=UPI003BEF982F